MYVKVEISVAFLRLGKLALVESVGLGVGLEHVVPTDVGLISDSLLARGHRPVSISVYACHVRLVDGHPHLHLFIRPTQSRITKTHVSLFEIIL